MLDAVKEDEALKPLAITPLGSQRVMFDAQSLADLLQEFHTLAPQLCRAVSYSGAMSRWSSGVLCRRREIARSAPKFTFASQE